jgi:hypothetical protein
VVRALLCAAFEELKALLRLGVGPPGDVFGDFIDMRGVSLAVVLDRQRVDVLRGSWRQSEAFGLDELRQHGWSVVVELKRAPSGL